MEFAREGRIRYFKSGFSVASRSFLPTILPIYGFHGGWYKGGVACVSAGSFFV